MPDSRPSFWTTLPGVLTGVAALITALVGVAALVMELTDAQTADPTTASSSVPTAPTGSAPFPSTTPSQASEAAVAALRASLPQDIDARACVDRTHSTDLPDDGAVAVLLCGASRTQPGPVNSYFYRYPTSHVLEQAFQTYVFQFGLSELPSTGSADCPDQPGYRAWRSGTHSGQVACFVAGGTGTVFWTQTDALAMAWIEAREGFPVDMQTLWAWWNMPAADMQVG